MALIELLCDGKSWLLFGEVKNNHIIDTVLITQPSVQITIVPICGTSLGQHQYSNPGPTSDLNLPP
jgi:hypothetical protein